MQRFKPTMVKQKVVPSQDITLRWLPPDLLPENFQVRLSVHTTPFAVSTIQRTCFPWLMEKDIYYAVFDRISAC